MNWNCRFASRAALIRRSAVRELLKLTVQPDWISFAGGLPAPEFFPVQQVREAAAAVLASRGGSALQYGETEGVAELREWIACRFSRHHRPICRDNVMIVSGGQQALDLIGRVLLDPGDPVVVENPTYLAALSAWRSLGARFLPVPSDERGLRVDELDRVLRERPKFVYTMPNFQNPQGTTMALERRHRLVELLRRHEVGLVEDNPYGDLRYEGDTLPHLLDLDVCRGSDAEPVGNTIYVGTFSKVLAPGLRVGWIIAAEPMIEKLVQAKQAADLCTSALAQHIALELVSRGVLNDQIPRLRTAYGARRDAMLAALARYFPPGARWTHPAGGMFLLVTLPRELAAAEVLRDAIQRRVAFVPGDDFHVDGSGRSTLRLNFSNAAPDRIEEGVRRLGQVIEDRMAKGAR